MVKIIKIGDISMKASKEFCCPWCGCIYESTEWHTFFKDGERKLSVECPWCKEIAHVPYKDGEDKIT